MKHAIPLICAVLAVASCGSPGAEEQQPSAHGRGEEDTPAVVTFEPNNPIIPNMGVNDPHIRIIDGKAYLSATHDKSADNTTFIMEDWWLW